MTPYKSQTYVANILLKILWKFLISNFRRVLNVVCFLLGDSPASEFYMPTFRNTLSHLHRQVGACRMNSAVDSIWSIIREKNWARKWPEPLGRRGTE